MNYKDWVKDELEGLSRSMGFRYVPHEELEDRLTRLRTSMEEKGIDAFLVVQKMDCYYLSGTTQDSMLFVPLDGKPLLMVRREVERARVESRLDDIVEIKSIRDMPSLISDHSGSLPKTLGLELDVLPVRDYFKYQDLFKDATLIELPRSYGTFARSNPLSRSIL
jgi:Xaa-Pro aminopeptidase